MKLLKTNEKMAMVEWFLYLKSGKKEDAIRFLEKSKSFTLAESLGVESLANHPALMTHASIPEDKRKEIGITDDFKTKRWNRRFRRFIV
jgi:O-acetylhomoserine/O-acetylserine sulfhydrylase-like pyridoxal-dependent enzyme